MTVRDSSLNLHTPGHSSINAPCEGTLAFDDGLEWTDLKNKWVHLAVVFDHVDQHVVRLALNGRFQNKTVDISDCRGSWDNTEDLNLFSIHGWKTQGLVRNLKIFSGALDEADLKVQAQPSESKCCPSHY